MAITITSLTGSGDATDANSYSTASITPGSNRLVLVFVVNRKGADNAETPTLSGNSLTYVQVATVTFNTLAAQRGRITLFRAMGASPTTGSITIDFGGVTQTSCVWSVFECDGVDTSGTHGSGAVLQSATNAADTAAALTVTLGLALGTGSASVGGFGAASTTVIDHEAGWTEIHDTSVTPAAIGVETQYNLTFDQTSTGTMNSGTANMGGIAVEIAAAAAATNFDGADYLALPVDYLQILAGG